jgi:hypothetical protein
MQRVLTIAAIGIVVLHRRDRLVLVLVAVKKTASAKRPFFTLSDLLGKRARQPPPCNLSSPANHATRRNAHIQKIKRSLQRISQRQKLVLYASFNIISAAKWCRHLYATTKIHRCALHAIDVAL